jgi:hypothetical protein
MQTFTSSKDKTVQFNTNRIGGAERDRTADPLLAKQVLSQLSYSPIFSLTCRTPFGLALHGRAILAAAAGLAKASRLSKSSNRCQSSCQIQPKKWWARADSNCRPHAYQACALTT